MLTTEPEVKVCTCEQMSKLIMPVLCSLGYILSCRADEIQWTAVLTISECDYVFTQLFLWLTASFVSASTILSADEDPLVQQHRQECRHGTLCCIQVVMHNLDRAPEDLLVSMSPVKRRDGCFLSINVIVSCRESCAVQHKNMKYYEIENVTSLFFYSGTVILTHQMVCYTEPSGKSPLETVWKRTGPFEKVLARSLEEPSVSHGWIWTNCISKPYHIVGERYQWSWLVNKLLTEFGKWRKAFRAPLI